VFIKFTFILFALSMFFNINSFLAAIGAAGITAGIGLQDFVAQFASGIQILMTHPFKAGDYIEVENVGGFVAEIRFMNTVITTVDNKRIVVPNSHLTKNRIVNFSAEETRRVDLTYYIGYNDDIEKAKSVIIEVASANQFVLSDPEPVVYVNSHGESSIELTARIWCKGENYWPVYFAMQEEVKLAFDRNGIHIPFNQLDIHIVENK
ncbi:MAG: mechanosensitive ion channel family protein, partial [Ruminococcus sp.]|nr:mechanosensitive ion channel family protein [Ruminococcus sp.]